jgi:hypothetical protein
MKLLLISWNCGDEKNRNASDYIRNKTISCNQRHVNRYPHYRHPHYVGIRAMLTCFIGETDFGGEPMLVPSLDPPGW